MTCPRVQFPARFARAGAAGRRPARALATLAAALAAVALLGSAPALASRGQDEAAGPKAAEIAELRQLLALQYPHLRPKIAAAPPRADVTESSNEASSREPVL